MDAPDKELLLRDLGKFGYNLAQPAVVSADDILRRMVACDDPRILEGVPVVLTNVLLSNVRFNLQAVESSLSGELQKRFRILAAVTLLFSECVPEGDSPGPMLYDYLQKHEPALIEEVTGKLRNQHKVPIGGGVVLDEERLEKTYTTYIFEQFGETKASFSKALEDERASVMNEAMGEFFTEKQKEVMHKVLNRQSLTKTEREYYSRVVKPRLKALRNSELQTMAATLLGY